ncbi:MAG: WG repeat-containing protein [Bacteroidota bacterium]|nr:WG repeat-containing protein [Bacteroidota bacterium]
MKMKYCFFILFFQLSYSLTAQLIPYRVGEKWGYSDTSGLIKIAPKYQETHFFENNFAFVMKDSFYYGINTSEKILCGPFKYHGDFSSGLCQVIDTNQLNYYINYDGKKAFNQNFDICEGFSEGLAVVSINKKLGIINTKGEWIKKPSFDTSSRSFKSGFLLALSKGRYFYLNKNGEEMILPKNMRPAGIFSDNYAPVYVKTKSMGETDEDIEVLQFIDTNGFDVLRNFIFEGFNYAEHIMLVQGFRDGKAIVSTQNEIGLDYYLIDIKGNFSPLYSFAKHLGDSLFIGMIGVYMPDIRIMDKNLYVMGQFQNKPTYIGEYSEGLINVRNPDGKWGYINNNCKTIIPFDYDEAYPFKNGYALVFKKESGLFYINQKGKAFYFSK